MHGCKNAGDVSVDVKKEHEMPKSQSSAGKTTQQTRFGEEPSASDETDKSDDSVRPKQSLEETLRTCAGTSGEAKGVHTIASDADSEQGITENPECDETSTETLV